MCPALFRKPGFLNVPLSPLALELFLPPYSAWFSELRGLLETTHLEQIVMDEWMEEEDLEQEDQGQNEDIGS